jgi:glycerate 2-kinase
MYQLSQIPGLRRSCHDTEFVILLAPDSFKNSCTAREACCAIERGIKSVNPKVKTLSLPLSDGGEGYMEVLLSSLGGKRYSITVHDPLMRPVKADYAIVNSGKTAIIEMAAASGIQLLSEKELDPCKTTTYGCGELILDAIQKGASRIIIGIGGSSTTDGGTGAAQALGIHFLDITGEIIPDGISGAYLKKIHSIDESGINPAVSDIEILVACDVENPFTGKSGAARIYSPQKGANPEKVKLLEEGMIHLSGLIMQKKGINLEEIPGSGAAGGLGGGLLAFLGARLKPGVEIILQSVNFSKNLKKVDLVITGEGKIDSQTINGKVISGILKESQKAGVPVIALAGQLDAGFEILYEKGLTAAFSIQRGPVTLKKAMKDVLINLEYTAAGICKILVP